MFVYLSIKVANMYLFKACFLFDGLVLYTSTTVPETVT
jgi:hypothetical protein